MTTVGKLKLKTPVEHSKDKKKKKEQKAKKREHRNLGRASGARK